MACGKIYLFLIGFLVSSVVAQEGSGNHDHDGQGENKESSFSSPFGSLSSNGAFPNPASLAQMFGSFFNPNNTGLPNFSSFFPFVPNFGGSRQEHVFPDFGSDLEGEQNTRAERVEPGSDVEEHEHEHNDASDRFFFFSGVRVACNYTATPGSRCTGCRERTICYPNNRGVIRVCTLFPYCNNGRCSKIPGSACTTSAANTTSATTTTSAATTTTGGTTATP